MAGRRGVAVATGTELGDKDDEADGLECQAAGAAALEGLGDCRSCAKLRLRLEHEERARVKAQEQLVKLQAEGRLRLAAATAGLPGAGADAAPVRPAAAGYPGAAAAATSAAQGPAGGAVFGADAANEEVGRSLESYRREVAILRQGLRSRDAREAEQAEVQRRLKAGHEVAKREWEGQVASLLCEVQDLEARNRRLEAALLALGAAGSAAASTAAPGSAAGTGMPSEATAPTATPFEGLGLGIG